MGSDSAFLLSLSPFPLSSSPVERMPLGDGECMGWVCKASEVDSFMDTPCRPRQPGAKSRKAKKSGDVAES